MTEADVIERLGGISAVTTLVDSRLYALNPPQQPTTPYIRVQRVTSFLDQHLRGPQYPARYRFQVDACAAEISGADPLGTAETLAAAVIGNGLGTSATGLFGWIGSLRGSPPEIDVQNVELLHAGDREFFPDELGLVRVRTDFLFHWRPA